MCVRWCRWGRNDNSPGEDAYLEGQYGAWMVLGGQGADPDGTYPLGERRKAICEMKHFDAYVHPVVAPSGQWPC